MDADDFHSLNKGVFVIPFQPDTAAGPSAAASAPEPLAATYAAAHKRFEDAYWDYEEECTSEQLDEIEAWLDECAAPPLFRPAFPIHRLPVALVQSLSPSVAPLLSTLARAATLSGRDMGDLAAATRAIAVGFMGEAALAAKKAGRTPIDEVERWWAALEDDAPLLVYIQNAQLIPATVLSELIYILNLHNTVPFRLVVSVPSIAVFTSTWSLLEPGDVALSIFSAGRSRRRGESVRAILNAASDPQSAILSISDSVRDELQREEDMYGGGPAATLKSLKWLLLNHAHNSPLSALAADEDATAEQADKLRSVVEGVRKGEDVPGQELFVLDSVPDLLSTQNPAVRISILQAMARPATFLVPEDEAAAAQEEDHEQGPELQPEDGDTDRTPRKAGRKRKAPDSPVTVPNGKARAPLVPDLGPRFKEIETLHALWASAGKSINLWDWLEGFRNALDDKPKEDGADAGEVNGEGQGDGEGEGEGGQGTTNGRQTDEDAADKEQAQHATFVRFIEECRMLGLVRARGSRTARRTDEVVKGVLMI